MKKFLFILFAVLFIFPQITFAHLAGQPPFFKVNGVYSALYDVPTTSFADFRLPQDKPPALYMVNEDINFEIDTNALPIPPEIVAISEFDWDFGDGSAHASGFLNSHRYEKPGSYFLEITAKTKDVSTPQLIQSTLIHIIPVNGYTLPQARILVNGVGTTDPLLDDVKVVFGNDFQLDASATTPGSGKIVEYIWDLGDGKSNKGAIVNYKYSPDQYAFFPVLRVFDENGLFSDAYIQITNTAESKSDSKQATIIGKNVHQYRFLYVGGVVGLLLIAGSAFVFRKK